MSKTATACGLSSAVHSPDEPSKLNKELNKLFPESKITQEGILYGGSSLYLNMRTDPDFLEWFGDWTNPEILEGLKEKALYKGILNSQGEPSLHKDPYGHVYVKNIHGDWKFLDVKTNEHGVKYFSLADSKISPSQMNDLINTLAGDYIIDKSARLDVYIKNRLDDEYEGLAGPLRSINKRLRAARQKGKDGTVKRLLAQKKQLTEARHVLEGIKDDSNIRSILKRRVQARLEKMNYRYTEDAVDKMDDVDKMNDIANFTLESSQTTNRAINDPEVLQFMSSIPQFESFHKDISEQMSFAKRNSIMSNSVNRDGVSYKYMNQSTVWRLLEDVLADVIPDLEPGQAASKDIFENMKRAIEQAVEDTQHPVLNYISNYLQNLNDNTDVSSPEAFATKFTTAFYKARRHFLITQVKKDFETGGLSYEIIDPAVKNNSKFREAHSILTTALNNPLLKPDSKDPKEAENEMIEALAEIKAAIRENFDKIKDGGTVDEYITFLYDMFNNNLATNVSKEAVAHYVRKTYANRDNSVIDIKKAINDFLNNTVTSGAIAPYLDAAVKGDIEMIKLLQKRAKGESANQRRDKMITYLLREGSLFREVGAAQSLFSLDGAESSVLLSGGKQWGFSNMTGIHRQVNRWKQRQDPVVKALAERNFKLANHLMSARSPLDMLNVYSNSEVKTAKDNNPTPNKKLTELDAHRDGYVKLFNSRDKFHEETTDKKTGYGSEEAQRNKQFRNFILYNFAADKNSSYSIHGLPNLGDAEQLPDAYDIENKALGKDLKRALTDYIKGEFMMAREAGELVHDYLAIEDSKKRRNFLMTNLIPGYHFNTDKDIEKEDLTAEDFQNGTYYRLGIFSSSLKKYLAQDEGTDTRYSNRIFEKGTGLGKKQLPPKINPKVFRKGNNDLNASSNLSLLMKDVFDDVNQAIQSDFKYLSDIVLVSRTDTDGVTEEKGLFDVEDNINTGSVNERIYRYIIGSFLSGYELSNLLNGHITFYKQGDPENIDISDFLKRAPAIGGDGLYLRSREGQPSKTYTTYAGDKVTIDNADDKIVAAVTNNIKIKESSYAKLIKQGTGNNISMGHEIADAQGGMTPAHFKDVITRIYGWEPNDQLMFDQLNNPKHKVTDENIDWMRSKSKSYDPLKLLYFGITQPQLDNQKGAPSMPVYFKYSVVPFFPAMVKGTEMETLVKKMEKQGVEQIVFKSGSKAANFAQTTIHEIDENGVYQGIKDDMKLNPFELDSENLRMQVEMPTKLNKEIAWSMQSIKNMLTNLNLDDKVYDKRNAKGELIERVTGQELYDEITQNVKDVLQYGLNTTLNKLGYEPELDDDGFKTGSNFNNRKVKELLLSQMDIETEQDLIAMLRTDLPLHTIPNFSQRAFPVISSYIKNKGSKVYTNGASAIQVANIGYDRIMNPEATDVFFFDDNNTALKPPLPRTNKKGEILYYDQDGKELSKEQWGEDFDPSIHKMRIDKARIMLPFTGIFEATGLSYDQFKELYRKGEIDKEIFQNIIGYRIPNQAMSSNDTFEIAGILPPIAGDQAVVYHEITAKTGSDFDIDKMYLAMPNFNVQYNKDTYRKAKDWVVSDLELSRDDLKRELMEEGYPESMLGDFGEMLNLFVEDVLFNQQGELYQEYAESNEIGGVSKITYASDRDTKKGKQNQLIENFLAILESQETFSDLMSELDSDDIKDTIETIMYLQSLDKQAREDYKDKTDTEQRELVKQYVRDNKINAIQQMFPVNLMKSRNDVMEAKTLVAIMANNMTDIGESQKTNFGMKFPLGFKSTHDTDLKSFGRKYQDGKEGVEEGKLSKVVSYFMNAAVDAAKDSYITSGNITSYSANSAMIMARLGLNMEDMFTVLMNKEIMQFSRYKTYQKSKSADFNFPFSQNDLDLYTKTFLNKLSKEDFNVWNVISREDFLSNNPAKKQDILGFWNLLQAAGKEFNNAVVAMKSESNGAGKNMAEMVSLFNRLERVKRDAVTNSFEKWFHDGKTEFTFNDDVANDPNAKILGAMANNSLFLMKELSEKIFVEARPEVIELTNGILAGLGDTHSTSAEMINLVFNYVHPYLLHSSGNPLYNINEETSEELLTEFPEILKQFKDENPDIQFLKQLRIETQRDENLIAFPGNQTFSQEDRAMYKQDIMNIMARVKNYDKLPKDHPNKKYANLIHNLVSYAFLTSGFKTKYYSFNDMLPAGFFINNAHDVKTDNLDPTAAVTLMAQVNHNNYKIVKNVGKKLFSKGNKPPKGEENIFITPEEDLVWERLKINKDNFAPFFKLEGNLYMYRGTVDKNEIHYAKIDTFDNKRFSVYKFHGVAQGLDFNPSIPYESEMHKFYKNIKGADIETQQSEQSC